MSPCSAHPLEGEGERAGHLRARPPRGREPRLDGAPARAWPASLDRHVGAVRHRLRQRRLLDLLRVGARRSACARADADRLHVRRRPVRADREDLRRGRGDVSRSRRCLIVRAPRVQRGRVVLRRLGTDARLHHHDRHLGLLRAPLPGCVLSAVESQSGRHHRRRRRHCRARGAQHPRPRRIGEPQRAARVPEPGDAGCARRAGRGARAQPVAAGAPGAFRHGAELDAADLRPVRRDGRLHRHRDRLEHGRGGQRPRPRRAARL